jgi:hypothetical protein
VIGYPNIVPNPEWIKTALLYWDQFCTIVPPDFQDRPSTELADLWTKNLFSPLFADELSGASKHQLRAELLDLAGRADAAGIDLRPSGEASDILLYGKLPRTIEDDLLDLGVSTAQRSGLLTSNALLTPMIGLVAKYFSGERSGTTDIYTVSTSSPTAAQQVFSPLGPDQPDVLVGKLILSGVLPVPGEDVPLDVVLKFRNRNYRKLLRFRSAFDDLVASIRTTSPDKLEAKVKEELEREVLELLQLETTSMLWRVGGASVLIAGCKWASDLESAWPAATWVLSGLGIAAITAAVHHVRNAPTRHDFSYLTRAAKDLG